jgi:UDP-N-acetylglucosamine 2-epimerase
VPRSRIAVVGKSVVDALLKMPAADEWKVGRGADEPLLVVTVHRRKPWGGILREIAASIRDTIKYHPKLQVIWPAARQPGSTKCGETTTPAPSHPSDSALAIDVLSRPVSGRYFSLD